MSTHHHAEKSDYQKLEQFFVKQIQLLQTPVIDDRPNCVSVGPYRVITNGKIYEVWRSRTHLYNFNKRNWAVGYALCLYQGNHRVAGQLIGLDRQYTKLVEESDIYKHHISNSLRQENHSRAEILECRLSRVDSEMIGAEKRAEIILKNLYIA